RNNGPFVVETHLTRVPLYLGLCEGVDKVRSDEILLMGIARIPGNVRVAGLSGLMRIPGIARIVRIAGLSGLRTAGILLVIAHGRACCLLTGGWRRRVRR